MLTKFFVQTVAYCGMFKLRQWLFRRRRQFALGIYIAVIIHVCLYSQIWYYRTSDSVV